MSVTVAEFWNLLEQSRLLPQARCEQLKRQYGSMKGAPQNGSARILAEWLVSENVLSRFQMQVLFAGRPGPFFYGDYQVQERYEGGRLAGLYRAGHIPTGHPVLLHFLSGPVTQNQDFWVRAAHTAEQARRQPLPGLMRFFELVDLVSFKFAVLELLSGESLDRVCGQRPLPAGEACRVARLAALALHGIHQSGRAYGELRPENIWVTSSGGVKLLQPPLAHRLEFPAGNFSLQLQDSDGRMRKKADYLAPELAAAGASPSPQGDLYALGCTLYEMLTGQPPFGGGNASEKVQRHASERIVPLEQQGVPEQLGQIVTYLMAKDRSVRFQQADQVAGQLAMFVEPAAQNPPPEQAPPTLPAFESHVAQRHEGLAREAASPLPVPDVQSSFTRAEPTRQTPQQASGSAPIAAEETSTASRLTSRRKSSNTNLLIGGAAVLLIAIGVGAILAWSPGGGGSYDTVSVDDSEETSIDSGSGESRPEKKSHSIDGNPTQAKSDPSSDPTAGGETREIKVPDNGLYLWASPTSGPPLSLEHLPPGGQIYIVIRPAELLLGPEGDKLLYAMGPLGRSYLDQLKAITGFGYEEIEQVVVSLEASTSGQFEPSFRLRLRNAMPTSAVVQAWSGATESVHDGKSFYQRGGRAYYLPTAEAGRVFTVTSVPKFRGWADVGLGPPPLRREMEIMLGDTDAHRQVNILFAPNILFTDAKKAVFSGGMERLHQPLFDFLGDDTLKSALLSLHVSETDFFAELRLGGTIDIPPQELARQIHERMKAAPKQLRQFYYADITAHPWTGEVVAEIPEWVRTLAAFTRSGDYNDQAILRAYLPASAAHNLLSGFELTLAQLGGGGGPLVAGPVDKEPQTLEEKLGQTISLSFPRDTLEKSVQMVAEEIEAPITILGQDLKLDGITKNQSFGIEMNDKPAREILTQIMLLANPDKTATGPDDPAQKLIYVIKPNDEGEEAIFVTTRQMATQRGDKLPEQFVVKQE